MKRIIAAITSSRADYSHLYWPLRELAARPDVEIKLIALGPHLAPEFGRTIFEIEKDQIPVAARIECLLSSDTDVGMAKSIGLAALSLADCLGEMRPDLLLLIADRYEMLAPAAVATALRIPLAHIEGGEITEGAIDDAIRNALTKLSHIHFTSTERARARVIAMGEEEWRVHCAGAPSLDHLRRSALQSRDEIAGQLGVDLRQPAILAAFHPLTVARETTREAGAFFAALAALRDPILFCYPNADAGSREMIERTREFAAVHKNARMFVNLNPVSYWSLLRNVDVVVGNSSSGIMEAASFAVPVVNVGMRQRGRERGRNVLDAEASCESILEQIAKTKTREFRCSLKGMQNPYGDGHAAERIAQVLATVPLDEELRIKHG